MSRKAKTKKSLSTKDKLFSELEMGFPPVAAFADKQSSGLFGACVHFVYAHKLLRNFLPISNPLFHYKQKQHHL